jgi:hypothetical protein
MTTAKKAEVYCLAKHTTFQVSDEDWKCPCCGATVDDFWVDEPDPDSSVECPLLHKGDSLRCFKCGESISGWNFADAVAVAKSVGERPTPNMDRLKAWFEQAKARGLVDIKLTCMDNPRCSPEEFAGDILSVLDAIDAGRFRPMTPADFGEEEKPR